MGSNWAFLIICIVILIITLLVDYFKYKHEMVELSLRNNREYFNPVTNPELFSKKYGFADESAPYTKPYVMNNVLSPEHCRQIIDYCRDKLVDSTVLSGKNKSVRDSQQTWIPKNHPLAKPIFDTFSKMYNIPVNHAEDLQVVRYNGTGQFYNQHHDSCPEDNQSCHEFVRSGGQRKLTILIYLNDDYEGGHTYFSKLNQRFKGNTGDAIVFHPLANNSSKTHPLALHGGEPCTGGEKWIANVWFRERPFEKN
jgi:prolyl 4-hydroxylase